MKGSITRGNRIIKRSGELIWGIELGISDNTISDFNYKDPIGNC